jgi:Cas6b C-terminal domain/Cas6b N-terminal domain
MNLKTLLLTFDIPLLPHQIPMWRGAIAEHAGWENDAFHNHLNAADRYKYRYPSVQYRCHDGQAALIGIGEAGVEALQDMLMASDGQLTMGGKTYRLRVADFSLQNTPLSNLPEVKAYHLRSWLALNPDNFREWERLPSLTARIEHLERILASNIIAFAKGIGWQIEERFDVTLLQLRATKKVRYHRTELMAFDVAFSTNLQLPEGIGLGKAASHGFGVLSAEKVRIRIGRIPLMSKDLGASLSPQYGELVV